MLDFHEKRRLLTFLYSRPFLALLTIPVGFFSYVAWNAHTTAQDTRERRLELAAELARLEERASSLERDIANLEDPRGVEAALRKRYEVGKEGEELIVLVEDEQLEVTSTPVHVEKGWWNTITDWF